MVLAPALGVEVLEQLLSRQVLALLHDAGEPAIGDRASWLTPLFPRKVKCSASL